MGAFDQPSAFMDVGRFNNETAMNNQNIAASQQTQQREQQMQPYKIQGAQQEIDAGKLKQAAAQLDFSLQTLQGVNDQASYDRWRQNMHANGIDTTGDPDVFDPAWKEQSMQQALSMKDQLGKYSATMVTGPDGSLQSIPFNTRTGTYGQPYTMPAGTTLAAKPGAGPMGPQEFQYLQTLSPEQQAKYLEMKRGPKTVNLGGEIGVMGPGGDITQRYTKSAAPMPDMSSIFGAAPSGAQDATGLTGDAYLATLPPNMVPVVKAMAEGRMAYPSGLALRNPMALKLVSAVQQYAPDSSANQLINIRRFDTGPQGNTTRSFNVVTAHLSTLGKLVDALDNGDVKAINAAANMVKEQTGKPAPTNFNSAKIIVADELTKAIIGSGSGALGDRQAVVDTINAANSPAQLKQAIQTYKELAKGQLQGLQQQYEASTGLTNFSDKYLMPETRKEFNANPPALGAEQPQTSMPTFTGPSDPAFIIAPKGTKFIAADTKKQMVKH